MFMVLLDNIAIFFSYRLHVADVTSNIIVLICDAAHLQAVHSCDALYTLA